MRNRASDFCAQEFLGPERYVSIWDQALDAQTGTTYVGAVVQCGNGVIYALRAADDSDSPFIRDANGAITHVAVGADAIIPFPTLRNLALSYIPNLLTGGCLTGNQPMAATAINADNTTGLDQVVMSFVLDAPGVIDNTVRVANMWRFHVGFTCFDGKMGEKGCASTFLPIAISGFSECISCKLSMPNA